MQPVLRCSAKRYEMNLRSQQMEQTKSISIVVMHTWVVHLTSRDQPLNASAITVALRNAAKGQKNQKYIAMNCVMRRI